MMRENENISPNDMNNIFITADTRFGHENTIGFCDRPFQSVEEMDKTLIANWNKVVGVDDIIYHLGAFTLGDFQVARKYFSQLNGKIQVLANHWHHDKRWLPKNYFGPLTLEYPDATADVGHVNILPPMEVLGIERMGTEGRPLAITLCHYPLKVWDRKHYGSWCLHGHTHEQDNSDEFILNVGVDCTNYSPINLAGVLERMYVKGWVG